MKKRNNIVLSSGTVLWLSFVDAVRYAKEIGCDGIELVPTKKILTYIRDEDLSGVHSMHQNWRLDSADDSKNNIHGIHRLLYAFLRKYFFLPKENTDTDITWLANTKHLPITVHDITKEWTVSSTNKPYSGGIICEILPGFSATKQELKQWLKNKKHKIAIDLRDDQSLVWAKQNGFTSWQTFWEWIGITNIAIAQLTLIGKKGFIDIHKRHATLAEEQLLWLHKQQWKGSVVIEANPLSIVGATGNLKTGLQQIVSFIQTTLQQGKTWS